MKIFSMDLNNAPLKYCVVDIETTGRKPSQTKVIEIAAYVVCEGKIIDEFQTLVHPETDINFFITKLTGINNEMVKDAPVFESIADQFIKISQNCIFVAHNVSFDYGILRREFKRLGIDYRRDHLCTVQVSRNTLKDVTSHNLGKLSKHLGIAIPNRHRASDDALATVELLNYLNNKTNIEDFIRKEINPDLLHPQLNINALDQIPDKPGIIKYYDENDVILHIEGVKQGASIIHQRLKPQNKNPEFLDFQTIAKIKFTPTGSEILAKIWEREAILTQSPALTHLEKRMSFAYSIYLQELRSGHLQVVAEKKYIKEAFIHAKNSSDLKNILKSFNQEYQLCFPNLSSKNKDCLHCKDAECLVSSIPKDHYNQETKRWIEEQGIPEGQFVVISKGTRKDNHAAFLVENKKITFTGIIPKFLVRKREIEIVKNNLKPFSNGTGSEELLRRYLTERDYKGMIPL